MALKEVSIWQHRPIAAIIKESLRFRGIKTQGIIATEIDCLFEKLTANAIWREPPTSEDAPDPSDNHLRSLLKTQHGDILVT